ncbi:transposase [[Kitasatospora] papulosa]|uniref:transposase n=1 Tax=[Kitasatospora] papulosa TaxID=1464011 RepID=UPI00380CBF74
MKNYPPEYKAYAVALYESRPDRTIRSGAADLGVDPETLRNWVRPVGVSRPRGHRTQEPSQPSAPLEAESAALGRRSVSWRRNARSCGRRRSILRSSSSSRQRSNTSYELVRDSG